MKILKSIFVFLIIIGSFKLYSQKMSFTAELHPGTVAVGESFELVYIIQNAEGKNFRAPNLNIFEILGGPNQSISTQSINGSWSQTISYSYILRASKPGNYHIPPAQINIGGRWVQSNPLTVEVKSQSSNSSNSTGTKLSTQDASKDFFIKVVPSKQRTYIGEQVLVDFILYTRKSIQNIQPLSEVVCDKSFVQEIKTEDLRDAKDVVVGGQTFRSQVLKRIAVFPQEAGTITVHPFELQIDFINDIRNSPFQSMFRPFDIISKKYSTKELTFQAASIPDPVPSDFTGAVGNFSLNLGISDIAVTTDDAISALLTIEGDGDIKRVISPRLNFGNSFEVYDPKTKEETTSERNGRLYSKKVLEYLLIPKQAGKFTISPTASFFDPGQSKYQSKSFNQIELTVTKGNSIPKLNQGTQRDDQTNSIMSLLKKLLVGISAFIIFGAIILLSYFRLKKKKTSIEKKPIPVINDTNPIKPIVKDPLTGLQLFIDRADSKGFYASLNQSLKLWLSQKLSLESSSIDSHSLLHELKLKEYPDGFISQVKSIFDTCEMVLYAGLDKSSMMPMILDQTKDVIQGISSKV